MSGILTGTEICEDVQEECAKFGTVVALKVPRPAGGSRQSPGVGRIFVKFSNAEDATKALRALAGRKFADRTVVTTYFPEVGILVTPIRNFPALTVLCRPTSMSELGRWVHGVKEVEYGGGCRVAKDNMAMGCLRGRGSGGRMSRAECGETGLYISWALYTSTIRAGSVL